ncbi:MAG: NAD-dependent epimerase/dehydratase family protein [Candidatus Thorarchaeota archaeon]
MKVLLTGAFGNIGESTLLAMFNKNYDIRCFDLKTERNEKISKKLMKKGNFEIIWGDILDTSSINAVVDDVDCIIHLAAIIPPLSEAKPDLAKSVNIEGTRNLINAAEEKEKKPKYIQASSVSLFGPTMHLKPPRTVDDPIVATDTYTGTKLECEKMVRASTLPWTILRFAATPPLEISADADIDATVFEMPLDQRVEFVHTRDVGQACANAVEADTIGKTLLIGGGPSNQMLEKEFLTKIFGGMGVGMLPDSAFKVATKPEEYYYTDWLDTTESQEILQYQSRSFEDYIEEMKSQLGIKRYLAKLFSGQAKKRMLKASPYYRESED